MDSCLVPKYYITNRLKSSYGASDILPPLSRQVGYLFVGSGGLFVMLLDRWLKHLSRQTYQPLIGTGRVSQLLALAVYLFDVTK